MPKNGQIIDAKASPIGVIDAKPTFLSVNGETVVYTETRSQATGNLMVVLGLTYPNTFSYTAPRL